MLQSIRDKIDRYNTDRAGQVFWAVVATIILGILLHMSDVSKMVDAFRRANKDYMSLSIIFGATAFGIWSMNWHNFFEITGIKAGFARTFQIFTASRFLNLVTPLGQFGGQPIMSYLVWKESNASYEEALATLSSADLIVIMPITIYTGIGYLYLKANGVVPAEVQQASTLALSLATFGVFMGYMGWRRPAILKDILFFIARQVRFFTGKDSNLVEKIDRFLTNLEDSYRHIGKHPRGIYTSFAFVHASYLCKIIAFFIITVSLGMNMSFFEALILIPLVSIANFSPTPGGTGAVEAALSGLTVVVVGASLSTALLATLIYRIATYWLGVVLGYVSMATLSFDADEYADFMAQRN
ncbi:MAG: YbhN family protein [Candidatus Nanohaloarchaea archaeon]